MIELKEPVKALRSENYLAVLEDADDVRHYWLKDGTYDGWDAPIEHPKAQKALLKVKAAKIGNR